MRRLPQLWPKMVAVTGISLVMAACSTPSPASYHPWDDKSGTGYSATQITESSWRVSFAGNSETKRDTVENYLLLRAAEITLEQGHTWFVYQPRPTDIQPSLHGSFSGFGPGNMPRLGGSDMVSGNLSAHVKVAFEAHAEILILPDFPRPLDPRAMNAQEVVTHLGPVAERPKTSG